MTENKVKKTESFASIFGDDFEESAPSKGDGVTTLKLDQLVPFTNHPFRLYEGERLNEMVESIKNFGVIVPIVVRKKGLKYEILSGHNRVNAAQLAGLSQVPSVVKDGLSEEEAILIVTETNLMQRSFSDLAHSERATVIATRHSAMKSQGIRTDLLSEIEKLSKAPNNSGSSTSRLIGEKLSADKQLGDEYGISARNISRYLRISSLTSEMKELVDVGKVGIYAGVDLSYLSTENQEMVEAIISENTFKVDMKKAALLRDFEKDNKLNWDTAKAIITGEALKQPDKAKPIKIQPMIISKYFRPNEDKKDIEKIIEKALAMYFDNIQKQEQNIEEEEELTV